MCLEEELIHTNGREIFRNRVVNPRLLVPVDHNLCTFVDAALHQIRDVVQRNATSVCELQGVWVRRVNRTKGVAIDLVFVEQFPIIRRFYTAPLHQSLPVGLVFTDLAAV